MAEISNILCFANTPPSPEDVTFVEDAISNFGHDPEQLGRRATEELLNAMTPPDSRVPDGGQVLLAALRLVSLPEATQWPLRSADFFHGVIDVKAGGQPLSEEVRLGK